MKRRLLFTEASPHRALPIFGLMVGVTWIAYHQYAAQVPRWADSALLGFIALICLECVAIMLSFTRRYRLLALGLMSFFLATFIAYSRVSSGGLGHPIFGSKGPTPQQVGGWTELIRALYLDAAILVAIGLNRWAWRHRREAFPWRRNESSPPIFFPSQSGDDLP